MVSKRIVIENYQGDADPTTLIPSAGSSFSEVEQLKEAVELLKHWQYKSALKIVDKNIKKKINLIDSLLLKGEISAMFEDYDAAIHVYETVLELEPENICALTMIIGHLNIVESNNEEIKIYTRTLEKVAPQIAHKLKESLMLIKKNKIDFDYSEILEPLDLICVFGYFLYDDGSMPDKLIERLKKTYELAKKYPQANILISGGAVQNKYCEAIEMKKKLIKMGLEEEKIVALLTAKDTVGNVWEFTKYIRDGAYRNICIVTSTEHLPRAWMSLYTGLKENYVDANLFAVAPEGTIHPKTLKREIRLSYQAVLRIAGLFDKASIENQLQN